MKTLAILGAGTGGTIVANRMVRLLPLSEWRVVVVDPEVNHLYQPGLLFLPFGADVDGVKIRPRADTLSQKVDWLQAAVATVDPSRKRIEFLGRTNPLTYDILVIASGSRIRPDMTEGLTAPDFWRRRHFDFYTQDGAIALRERLDDWPGGRLVINVVEMPIKCPVAPLEFAFLADAFFRERNIREDVEIEYVVPLDAAFTKPAAAAELGHLLADKGVKLTTDFATGSVDGSQLVSWDDRTVPYDLLVTIPTHTGASFIETSQLGDELAFVPTDKHTLAARGLEDVFVIGDATDLPSSKAGSVAHYQAETLAENLLRASRHQELEPGFDGHSTCFVETGDGKALLIDFNYDVDPLPGHFPLPGVGPFSLLSESRINHLGKLAFRWMYWHGLLPARPMPIGARMTMTGKQNRPGQPNA